MQDDAYIGCCVATLPTGADPYTMLRVPELTASGCLVAFVAAGNGGCIMSRHDGAHSHGHGGGGWVALVVVALVLIGAVGKAAGKAVAEASHVLAVVLEVALITVVSLVGLAVAVALGWAGLRLHRRYTNRAAAADRRPLDQPVTVTAEVVQAEPQAIEAPRSWLDPYAAAGIRKEVTDDAWLSTGKKPTRS